MSFRSRIFGRGDDEVGVLGLGLNSKDGGRGGIPAPSQPGAADLSTVSMMTLPAKGSDAPIAAPPTDPNPGPQPDADYRRGDLIRGVFRVENVLAGGMGVVYICRALTYEEASKSPDALRSAFQGPPGLIANESSALPSDRSGSLAHERSRYHVFKSIRRELVFHGDVRRRFNNEALIWVSLRPHPNIVRAATFDANGPLLFLEYVDGGNLGRRLGQPLAVQEVARIALQFCRGMIFLFESAGIIHRDIKPANILLTHDGTVKITDFGLAKAFSGPPERQFQRTDTSETKADFGTRCGVIMGSLPWMSPEQITAPSEVTVASDVYSFGVVLYEMLTGRMPYAASSGEEWIRKVLHQTPASPANSSGVDEEASAIVMKCLGKKPEHRFRDFVELRTALEPWAIERGWSTVIPAPITTAELESAMTDGDWAQRGYALGQLGRNEDSYRSYQRALDLNPDLLLIHTNIGTALMRLGRVEEGLRHHQKEAEIHPEIPGVWDTLALGYVRCKRLPDALDAARKASEIAPDNISIVRNYAFVARLAGAKNDYEQATASVKSLLDRPAYNSSRSLINEAVQFILAGDVNMGLALHVRSANKYQGVAAVWYNYGVTMHRAGQLEQAIDLYTRAINLENKLTMAWVYRGVIRVHRGEYDLARSDWQAAQASDPRNHYSQILQIWLGNNLVPFLKTHPKLKDSWETISATAKLQYVY